jgi:DNA-directed RNA polymerase specialized sigma24 family protein
VKDLAVTFADEATNTNMDRLGELEEPKDAIATLPTMQRDAIPMLKLSEMSLKEAADASHTSVGALKVATHRAMTALRKMLVKNK